VHADPTPVLQQLPPSQLLELHVELDEHVAPLPNAVEQLPVGVHEVHVDDTDEEQHRPLRHFPD
jgi:hypothetical protein